jgi:tRNA G18 (ribose-2'-O)-methylase SpoU
MRTQQVAEQITYRLGPSANYKLHFLLYYCQAWSLVWKNEELFSDPIEAWECGPVIKNCYDSFFNPINHNNELVDKVIDLYGDKSGKWLFDLCSCELPWKQSRIGLKTSERGDRIISLELMKLAYAAVEEKRKQMSNSATWYDQRNIADNLKHLDNDGVRNYLQENALPYACLMQHLSGDWNISTVFRNANAFMAKELFYYGKKQIDRRGCQGIQNYSKITNLQTLDQLKELKSKYKFVAIELTDNAKELSSYTWEPNTLIVLGEENNGIVPEVLDLCEDVVKINQGGSVRSINVGVASGIVMNDIYTKLKR